VGSATAHASEVVEADGDVREIEGRAGCGDHGHERAAGEQLDGFRATEHVPGGGALIVEGVEEESREGAWVAVRVQQKSCQSVSYRPRR
jgi:hypothetical protein